MPEAPTTRPPGYNPDCPACVGQRLHSPDDWKLHPNAGHGYTKETGWTKPELQPKETK